MAKVFKTLDEALEAQTKQKNEVEKVKKELTKYYTKNKLKRNEDYTDNSTHGPKIAKLENEIDKKEETMAKVNKQVKDLEKKTKTPAKGTKTEKGAKTEKTEKKEKAAKGEGRTTKYDYPKDCDTALKKKVFRVAARTAEKNGKPLPTSYKEVEEAKAEKSLKKESKPKKDKESKEEPKKEKAAKETKTEKSSKKTKSSKKEKEEPVKEEKSSKKKKSKKVEDD